MYEVHNSGAWYDVGFVLGAGILFSGGFLGARRNSTSQAAASGFGRPSAVVA
jgi:hypothetical protein